MKSRLIVCMSGVPAGAHDSYAARSPWFGRLRTGSQSPQAWLRLLRWAVPLMLFVLVVGYEFGPARWLNDRLGTTVHFLAEIIVYGTVGPILAYLLLDFFSRWMAERETSDLQAKMLAEANLHAQLRFVQNDDALQDLFAASVILNSLQERSEELPPDLARQVAEAKRAVGDTLQHVYDVRNR